MIASKDIGYLGPAESEPVFYDWKWYYSVPALASWILLALAIVAVRDNRNRQALRVLLPLLGVGLAWLIFKLMMGFQSRESEMFGMMVTSLVIGISLVWLLGHKIACRNRILTFLSALAITLATSLIGAISYGLTDFSSKNVATLLLLILGGWAALAGVAGAAWGCRKHLTTRRFVLWQAISTLAASAISVALLYVTVLIIEWTPPSAILMMVFQLLAMALVMGLCVCAIVLPFTILALCNPFYRERLQACLQLESMDICSLSQTAPQAPQQNTTPSSPPDGNPD